MAQRNDKIDTELNDMLDEIMNGIDRDMEKFNEAMAAKKQQEEESAAAAFQREKEEILKIVDMTNEELKASINADNNQQTSMPQAGNTQPEEQQPEVDQTAMAIEADANATLYVNEIYRTLQDLSEDLGKEINASKEIRKMNDNMMSIPKSVEINIDQLNRSDKFSAKLNDLIKKRNATLKLLAAIGPNMLVTPRDNNGVANATNGAAEKLRKVQEIYKTANMDDVFTSKVSSRLKKIFGAIKKVVAKPIPSKIKQMASKHTFFKRDKKLTASEEANARLQDLFKQASAPKSNI